MARSSLSGNNGIENAHGAASTARILFGLFALALILRAAALPFAANNGTDAWARYEISLQWIANPWTVPNDTWLPLHFWLLGAVLAVWKSIWMARGLTVVLGALTILPFWGVVRRVFGRRIAIYASVYYAAFGFHVAYSTTTSAEAPTIFFFVTAVYGWVAYLQEKKPSALALAGAGFIAATLCRYEVWLSLPVFALALFARDGRWFDGLRKPSAWRSVIAFSVASGLGCALWMAFSFLKWGDPLFQARSTNWQSTHLMQAQSLLYRLAAVPGALAITMSPLVAGLGVWGALKALRTPGSTAARVLAAVGLIMFAFHFRNSVSNNMTMARFTLMYSWIFVPFAFCALQDVWARHRAWPSLDSAVAVLVGTGLAWQMAVTAGAYLAPTAIAAKLTSVAVTLPGDPDLLEPARWLKDHADGKAVMVDEFNFGARGIQREAGLSFSNTFVPGAFDPPETVAAQAIQFIHERRPAFLLYHPRGALGLAWKLGDGDSASLGGEAIHLKKAWSGREYRIYRIESGIP
jgi:hypothetical protein